MKLGIVIYSMDAEAIWNAFRLGVFALKQGDSAKAFLLAKGVECEKFDAFPQSQAGWFDANNECRTKADARFNNSIVR